MVWLGVVVRHWARRQATALVWSQDRRQGAALVVGVARRRVAAAGKAMWFGVGILLGVVVRRWG